MIIHVQNEAPQFRNFVVTTSAVWVLLSAALFLAPGTLVAAITRKGVRLPTYGRWLCRLLAIVNMAGALHFLMTFRK